LGEAGYGNSRVQPFSGSGKQSNDLGRGLQNPPLSETPEQSGRIVVEKGNVADVKGTLRYDGSEWYLDTDDGSYILHFGNSAYVESTGMELQAEDPAEVRGFVSGEEIAVISAVHDAQIYTFRDEDGTPLWAGRGRREGRIAEQDGSRGGSAGTGGRGQGRQGNQGGQGRSRV
jgi:hypothetical protein